MVAINLEILMMANNTEINCGKINNAKKGAKLSQKKKNKSLSFLALFLTISMI